MGKPFRLVGVAGTFDLLHKGHKALLRKAYEVGELVVIGLTTDEFAAGVKLHDVAPYRERLEELLAFILHEGQIHRTEVVAINDPYGPALWDGGFEALIVSEETAPRAEELNRLRAERGLKPLELVVIPMVLAEDGEPISTTRIRAGEIDREGHLLGGR